MANKKTRLFQTTFSKVRPGDYVAQNIVNGHAHGWSGVVDAITILAYIPALNVGMYDLHLKGDCGTASGSGDQKVWVEREY